MGGLGRIIGGALAGLGDGLEKQTTMNYQSSRDELINQREVALAKLRGEIDRGNTAEQYNLMDRNAGRDDARGFAYGTQTAGQKQAFETQNIILKGNIDLTNDKTIAGLKHTYDLSEQAADDARELANQLTLNGVTVDHWEISTDGKLGAYSKDGHLLTQTMKPGSFQTKQTGDDDGGTIGDAVAVRGGGGKSYASQSANPDSFNPSSTKPTAQKPVKQSVLSQLSRMPPPPGGQVGRTMTGPKGMKARWDGKQWVLEDVNGG